jgi:hypothetical protein
MALLLVEASRSLPLVCFSAPPRGGRGGGGSGQGLRRRPPGGRGPPGGAANRKPPSRLFYYALYKPFNVLCQFSPVEGKRTLADVAKVSGTSASRQ